MPMDDTTHTYDAVGRKSRVDGKGKYNIKMNMMEIICKDNRCKEEMLHPSE